VKSNQSWHLGKRGGRKGPIKYGKKLKNAEEGLCCVKQRRPQPLGRDWTILSVYSRVLPASQGFPKKTPIPDANKKRAEREKWEEGGQGEVGTAPVRRRCLGHAWKKSNLRLNGAKKGGKVGQGSGGRYGGNRGTNQKFMGR